MIWFADPVDKVLLVFLDDIYAPIGGSSVDNDVFEVWIRLIQD